jgi:hypothetical protein
VELVTERAEDVLVFRRRRGFDGALSFYNAAVQRVVAELDYIQ